MVDHYPDGHNVGLGMVELSAEEREIERLERRIAVLQAGLRAAAKWLKSEIAADVQAPKLPTNDKWTGEYRNDLAAMRRALGKT